MLAQYKRNRQHAKQMMQQISQNQNLAWYNTNLPTRILMTNQNQERESSTKESRSRTVVPLQRQLRSHMQAAYKCYQYYQVTLVLRQAAGHIGTRQRISAVSIIHTNPPNSINPSWAGKNVTVLVNLSTSNFIIVCGKRTEQSDYLISGPAETGILMESAEGYSHQPFRGRRIESSYSRAWHCSYNSHSTSTKS